MISTYHDQGTTATVIAIDEDNATCTATYAVTSVGIPELPEEEVPKPIKTNRLSIKENKLKPRIAVKIHKPPGGWGMGRF
jgi:hypothetical protein